MSWVDPFAGAIEAAWSDDEEADDLDDALDFTRALFPVQDDPLADLREPERRPSNRRQKPYGTLDPDHALHQQVRQIFNP